MGRYRVPDGSPDILGYRAGESFDMDISATQEARLVARGQLIAEAGLRSKPREELDEMARALNLNPDQYPNKESLIDAIQAEQED